MSERHRESQRHPQEPAIARSRQRGGARVLLRVLASALCTVPAACELSGDPVAVVEVRTDAAVYAPGAPITARVTNHTRRDAFFNHCDNRLGFVVEGRSGGGWQEVRSVDTICLGIHESGVTALRPGETYTGVFTLDETGTFRLRFLTGPRATSVGYSILYSNEFEIVEP
jgi:hypothetical protein